MRKPKGREVIGKVRRLLGADRLRVKCADGKERICRIPGRLKKRVWVRKGDLILVEKWELEPEKRGDLIWRYSKSEVAKVKKEGLLKNL